MLENGLYIVATPIGNIKDISRRACEILEEAEIIACEDTRVTKKLLSLLGVSLNKKFIVYEDHNEKDKADKIVDTAKQNAVVLVSDAGSPLISDPGFKLVRLCRENNVYVTAVPGACALISALQLSGLPTNRFMFAGFIPNKDKARQNLFNELKDVNTTLVFYETASRLLKTLEQAKNIFLNREMSVVRELTKMYEEAINGSADELITHFSYFQPKGEFVVVIAPPEEMMPISQEDVRADLQKMLASVSLKSAVSEVCKKYNLKKNDVYDLALEIKNEKLL